MPEMELDMKENSKKDNFSTLVLNFQKENWRATAKLEAEQNTNFYSLGMDANPELKTVKWKYYYYDNELMSFTKWDQMENNCKATWKFCIYNEWLRVKNVKKWVLNQEFSNKRINF